MIPGKNAQNPRCLANANAGRQITRLRSGGSGRTDRNCRRSPRYQSPLFTVLLPCAGHTAVGDQFTVIVTVGELLTPPELAPITVVPGAMVVARPDTLGAFAMVATLATEELQCAMMVRSWVLPSLNDPVATNC